ncbi:hypothetical protein D3C71_1471530 [compost metagenome]
MTYRNRIRMLKVANRRLRRAKHFLMREKFERAIDEIETTIVIISRVFVSLKSYRNTRYPRKSRGRANNE